MNVVRFVERGKVLVVGWGGMGVMLGNEYGIVMMVFV